MIACWQPSLLLRPGLSPRISCWREVTMAPSKKSRVFVIGVGMTKVIFVVLLLQQHTPAWTSVWRSSGLALVANLNHANDHVPHGNFTSSSLTMFCSSDSVFNSCRNRQWLSELHIICQTLTSKVSLQNNGLLCYKVVINPKRFVYKPPIDLCHTVIWVQTSRSIYVC